MRKGQKKKCTSKEGISQIRPDKKKGIKSSKKQEKNPLRPSPLEGGERDSGEKKKKEKMS